MEKFYWKFFLIIDSGVLFLYSKSSPGRFTLQCTSCSFYTILCTKPWCTASIPSWPTYEKQTLIPYLQISRTLDQHCLRTNETNNCVQLFKRERKAVVSIVNCSPVIQLGRFDPCHGCAPTLARTNEARTTFPDCLFRLGAPIFRNDNQWEYFSDGTNYQVVLWIVSSGSPGGNCSLALNITTDAWSKNYTTWDPPVSCILTTFLLF